jgi:hypothetical protein
MAKINRTKEIWHIPKRGNVHQTIYMVYCLTSDKFLNKAWSTGKQEMMASEMGKAGVTESGKALSHQSVRTLLANVPKYLGFIYIDNSTNPPRVVVTEVGDLLLKTHEIDKIPKHRKLSDYRKTGDLIETSEIFELQMAKLIITNPIIRNDCTNILVFPFRMTIRLILELGYLDIEEIAYFLFHTKSEDEFDLKLQQIRNFRNLTPERRQAEIDAYKKTEEGKLTLVKAPTARYYMYLCFSTGLCKTSTKYVNKVTDMRLSTLKLKDMNLAREIIDKFQDAEIYDFKENSKLWIDYFSNPHKLNPPIDIKVSFESNHDLLILIHKEGDLVFEDTIGEDSHQIVFPAFHNEDYEIVAYSLVNGNEVFKKIITADRNVRELIFRITSDYPKTPRNSTIIINNIGEVASGKFGSFDKEYGNRLEILGKILSRNFKDSIRVGGRFEYLFFELLLILKAEGKIDEVYWYGKIGDFGLPLPAPGGPNGNPDIVFFIDNFTFVLELTTIRGNRSQWQGSEASSVPDHIRSYKKNNPKETVIGIFSAPSIHEQLERNLRLNAQEIQVSMVFIPSVEFATVLKDKSREELLDFLLKMNDEQLAH